MSENNQSDEISLLDLFKVLARYKKLIVGLPLLGAFLAAIFASVILHPTWEASAVLEIGKVGQVLVEPPVNVVTRMMLPSFAKGSINSAGTKSDELYSLKNYYKTVKATQIKGADLIEVKLRGPSAEKVNDIIRSVIANLQKTHTEMMAVSIERNKKQFQLLSDDIKKVSLESELLKKKLLATHNWNAFDATLSATLLKDKTTDLRDMIQRKLTLEEQLTPSRTYTTRLVDEVYISEGPVSPNKPLIIGLAILLGLFGAIVFAFAHNAITSKTSK
jgi:uncharacterized protein involved in exopolysaccharide biosynthesis